jgi:hypothetical protein
MLHQLCRDALGSVRVRNAAGTACSGSPRERLNIHSEYVLPLLSRPAQRPLRVGHVDLRSFSFAAVATNAQPRNLELDQGNLLS